MHLVIRSRNLHGNIVFDVIIIHIDVSRSFVRLFTIVVCFVQFTGQEEHECAEELHGYPPCEQSPTHVKAIIKPT